MSRTIVVMACLTTVGVVGLLDWSTGFELRLFPLYFVPIAGAALRAGRTAGIAVAGLSTVSWYVANVPLAEERWGAVVTWINALTQTVAFGTIALLIAELRRRLENEKSLSRIDALTALPNKRAFGERAGLLLAMARRSGKPFTLAYADLDNFKRVNDEQGHAQGDEALRTAADLLRRHTRDTDVVARLGGDEFALFMPDCGEDDARAVFARLRDEVLAAMRGRGWPITMSVGAVVFTAPPATLDAAVSIADALMYQAKQRGKDQLCVETRAPALDTAARSRMRPHLVEEPSG